VKPTIEAFQIVGPKNGGTFSKLIPQSLGLDLEKILPKAGEAGEARSMNFDREVGEAFDYQRRRHRRC